MDNIKDFTDEIEIDIKALNSEPKLNYKMVALLVGYLGHNYHGVQIQNGQNVKTIEGDLFKALEKSEAVRKENCFDTKKMSFQRCSRTDKHVSALRQVFSLKMQWDPTIIEKINLRLPKEIRVFGIKKVTKKFNAKSCCSSRIYEYMIPSYAYASSLESTQPDFRISESQKDTLHELISIFKGTHDFYNFTAKRPNDQKPLKRYIIDFDIKEILLHENIQFIVFVIQGQSFMLHQIRYMIGFTIMVMRGAIPIDEAKNTFSSRSCRLVKAPAVGLILENILYDYYNKKFKNDQSHPAIDWSDCQETVLEFKKNVILKHIFDDETTNNITKNWIFRRFDPQSEYWLGKFSAS